MNKFILLLCLIFCFTFAISKDCGRGCEGCKSGRCDVFGCSGNAYCCLDISKGRYGYCCSYCIPNPVPENCLNIPQNTGCSFYQDCLEKYQNCSVITNIAYPKCQDYIALEDKLTPFGKDWSNNVRRCLQQYIATDVLQKEGQNFNCNDVNSTFFDKHLDCYMEKLPNLPYGICSLPISDQGKIVFEASDIIFKKHVYWVPIKTGVELIGLCSWKLGGAVVKRVESTAKFYFEQVLNYFIDRTISFFWNAVLSNSIFFKDIPNDLDQYEFLVMLQYANYTGPNTNVSHQISVDEISLLLFQSVQLGTNGTYVLSEFNGKPINSTLYSKKQLN